MEALRLRVQDLDFERRQIIVRDGEGDQDRVTLPPDSLIAPLQEQSSSAERSNSTRRTWRPVTAPSASRA